MAKHSGAGRPRALRSALMSALDGRPATFDAATAARRLITTRRLRLRDKRGAAGAMDAGRGDPPCPVPPDRTNVSGRVFGNSWLCLFLLKA